MRAGLNQKVINVAPPGAIVDNAAFTTAVVDTKGWAFVTFIVILGALDIALAALKLRESDASDMSGAVDIDGADYSTDATLPAATADNNLYAIHVNCTGSRERYLDLSLTGGDGTAGTYATVIAILSRPEESPKSAAARGFTAELTV